jgi:hypothetical protein
MSGPPAASLSDAITVFRPVADALFDKLTLTCRFRFESPPAGGARELRARLVRAGVLDGGTGAYPKVVFSTVCPLSIPAEFVGQVRAARARLAADVPRLESVVRPMIAQFEAEARRGRLTPWLWGRSAARWREATEGPDRMAFHSPDPAARRRAPWPRIVRSRPRSG